MDLPAIRCFRGGTCLCGEVGKEEEKEGEGEREREREGEGGDSETAGKLANNTSQFLFGLTGVKRVKHVC